MRASSPTTRVRRAAVALALGFAVAPYVSGLPSATDDVDHNIELGRRLYQEKAQCASCHGWAGDGYGDPHSAGRAANLRKTLLTHGEIVEVISCGRPGRAMPHFNAFAYSEDVCYGMSDAQVGADKPPDPPAPLQPREIEAVADYVMARIVGRGTPTKAECLEYYGGSPRCEEL